MRRLPRAPGAGVKFHPTPYFDSRRALRQGSHPADYSVTGQLRHVASSRGILDRRLSGWIPASLTESGASAPVLLMLVDEV